MKYAVVTRAQKPKVINGFLVSIDRNNLEWLDKVLHVYTEPNSIRKMIRHLPNVRAIEVTQNGKICSFIVITPKSNKGQFQVDHFTGENLEADFSLSMICGEKGINFKDLTPGVSEYEFGQVANFTIGIFMYEFLTKIEPKAQMDHIVPFEVFGRPLV